MQICCSPFGRRAIAGVRSTKSKNCSSNNAIPPISRLLEALCPPCFLLDDMGQLGNREHRTRTFATNLWLNRRSGLHMFELDSEHLGAQLIVGALGVDIGNNKLRRRISGDCFLRVATSEG